MRPDLYTDMYWQEEYYWWHRAKRRLVKTLLPPKDRLKILDIGCGTGKLVEELQAKGEVWGVDINETAISFCRQRGLSRVFVGKLPVLNITEHFDVIICLDVLEHIKKDHLAIKNIQKLLKPGGKLILTVPAYQWLYSYWDKILHHYRRYSPQHLRNCFLGTDLYITKLSFFYSYLLPFVIPFRFIRQKKFTKKTPTSDFIKLPQWLNSLFFALAKVEHFFIQYVNIPFGISLLCIAEKK